MGTRDIERGRQFDIRTDVLEAKRRSAVQREFERAQFLGQPPGTNYGDYDQYTQGLLRGLV
jgi:hypothetical protein